MKRCDCHCHHRPWLNAALWAAVGAALIIEQVVLWTACLRWLWR